MREPDEKSKGMRPDECALTGGGHPNEQANAIATMPLTHLV